jgi:hypothetical protein
MKNLVELAREVREQRDRTAQELQRLDNALAAINGLGAAAGRGRIGRKRRISAAGRRRIAAAARARWARIKAETKNKKTA